MALVQQVQKTKQQADDIYVLTEQANSAIVTPPVAQPELSAASSTTTVTGTITGILLHHRVDLLHHF